MEPVEHLTIDVPEQFTGTVIEKLGPRKGEMTKMHNHGSGRVRLEFRVPQPRAHRLAQRNVDRDARNHRDETRSSMDTFLIRARFRSGPPARSLPIARDRRPRTLSMAFRIRGILFLGAGVEVYEGMIVGEHSRDNDLDVNVVREKKLTNMRASSADDALRLVPYKTLNLEQAIEFIADDEFVEVTPKSLRLRKKVLAANKRPKGWEKTKQPASV
ncbi:MAG: hypothetical protein WDM87_07745 [Terracidiphilus sp.]